MKKVSIDKIVEHGMKKIDDKEEIIVMKKDLIYIL